MKKPLAHSNVTEHAKQIIENVAHMAAQSGRSPQDVRVMAVTKTVEPAFVNEAIQAGITLLGENKAQELCGKYESYSEGAELHFIGHLQSNKVKQIIDKVSMVQSVGSLHLAQEIAKQAQQLGKVMPVLVEVNIGAEQSKSGILPDALEELLAQIGQLSGVQVQGLMTIPPFCEEEKEIEKFFFQMRQLFLDIDNKKIDNVNMNTLSMGMSQDYELAVKYGSTLVRVGTALFGARNDK